jgi:hypothetical protein
MGEAGGGEGLATGYDQRDGMTEFRKFPLAEPGEHRYTFQNRAKIIVLP